MLIKRKLELETRLKIVKEKRRAVMRKVVIMKVLVKLVMMTLNRLQHHLHIRNKKVVKIKWLIKQKRKIRL